MSNDKIPGVPEGWELIHAFRRAVKGEWYIDNDGTPHLQHMSKSVFPHPIIRKIEKPARYRPFANAEEFKPHRDRWARVIKEHNMSGCDLDDWLTDSLRFMGQDKTGVCAPGGWLTYGCAFECFVFDDDGTPFGVRIDE
jgi:hypothetical protein